MDSGNNTDMGSEHERVIRPLTREQAIRLLRTVPMGRIAFTYHAMPAIRPVNHFIDKADRIIIRSHEGASIVTAAEATRGAVVSYQADRIDTEARAGWSVVATGLAWIVNDPRQAACYRERLTPWVTGQRDYIISIEPTMVTAFELTRGRNGAPERLPALGRPGFTTRLYYPDLLPAFRLYYRDGNAARPAAATMESSCGVCTRAHSTSR